MEPPPDQGKTSKELVVDFCRHRYPSTQVNNQRPNIDIITSHRYLEVHLNNNLDWADNPAALRDKKG